MTASHINLFMFPTCHTYCPTLIYYTNIKESTYGYTLPSSSPDQKTQQRIRYQVMLNATSGVSGCIIPELEAQETLTINVCFDPQGGMIFLILG